jgi:transposase InsO family protein
MATPQPPPTPRALFRYEVIAAYVTAELARGQKQAVLNRLAARTWTDEDGQPIHVAAETIRAWARRYRNHGLAGLVDAERPQRGVHAISPQTLDILVRLKEDVPQRSLERLIQIGEETGLFPKGEVRRSTLHRALRSRGISTRRPSPRPDDHDLDRFEADAPNDLWQSDLVHGPWLPDPARPGKVRKTRFCGYLDDHSRLLLDGRFSFRENQPALELVLRRAMQKHGLPRRYYYDNGGVYRAHHMREIAAQLGVAAVVFTTVRRPMGHGKIEAFNRLLTNAFIAEVQASSIKTLDELNLAFSAWVEPHYNRAIHGETGEQPLLRWQKAMAKIRFAEEETLRRAFLFRETRKPDKAGVFSLFGVEYQVGPALATQNIVVQYDPERRDEVEVFHEGHFRERVRPFAVHTHRRPTRPPEDPDVRAKPRTTPVVDWLAHLVRQRDQRLQDSPVPPAPIIDRAAQDHAVLAVLHEQLDPAVVDAPYVLDWLYRHGPIDPDFARQHLTSTTLPRDHHVGLYLDTILRAARKGTTP